MSETFFNEVKFEEFIEEHDKYSELENLNQLLEYVIIESVKKEDYEVTNLLGADFKNCTEEELRSAGIKSGVKISTLRNGKLKSAGIREGFIITSIDKKPISSPNDADAILRNKQGGVLIEGVYPDGSKAYYAIGM